MQDHASMKLTPPCFVGFNTGALAKSPKEPEYWHVRKNTRSQLVACALAAGPQVQHLMKSEHSQNPHSKIRLFQDVSLLLNMWTPCSEGSSAHARGKARGKLKWFMSYSICPRSKGWSDPDPHGKLFEGMSGWIRRKPKDTHLFRFKAHAKKTPHCSLVLSSLVLQTRWTRPPKQDTWVPLSKSRGQHKGKQDHESTTKEREAPFWCSPKLCPVPSTGP